MFDVQVPAVQLLLHAPLPPPVHLPPEREVTEYILYTVQSDGTHKIAFSKDFDYSQKNENEPRSLHSVP
jgi:hypothetical protein